MTAVPRCSAPRSAFAGIRRERSTESSEASRGVRVAIQDFARASFHARRPAFVLAGQFQTRATTRGVSSHSSIAATCVEITAIAGENEARVDEKGNLPEKPPAILSMDRGFTAETPEPRKRSDSYKSPEEEKAAATALLGLARKPSYKSPEEDRSWARASATPANGLHFPNKGPNQGLTRGFARPGPRIQAWGLVVTARRRLMSPCRLQDELAKLCFVLK